MAKKNIAQTITFAKTQNKFLMQLLTPHKKYKILYVTLVQSIL